MVRMWIVLLSLTAAGSSFIYKINYRSAATEQISSAVTLVAADMPDRPANKGDRLDVRPVANVPAKAVVNTTPIAAPVEIADVKNTAPEKAKKITSRHWRSSYARMMPRRVRQPQPPEQAAKPEDMRSRVLSWLKIGG
jgi:hypothetical protein